MSGNNSFAFDEVSPIEIGYLPNEIGIIFPSNHGFSFRTQTGGVCCHQLTGAGTYLSLGSPKLNRGFPDWLPDTDGGVPKGETHPVADVDLETIPDEDYETLPEWVTERDPVQFYNWNEFSYWLNSDEPDDAYWYGWTNLVTELKRWNYCPDGSMSHAHDMTRLWESLDEIWAAIDNCLSFTYEEYDYHDAKMKALQNDEEFTPPLDDERLPRPCEGIKWITITGSKINRDGNIRTPWAETLTGETVLLHYPNSD